jgi:hypothetical protein
VIDVKKSMNKSGISGDLNTGRRIYQNRFLKEMNDEEEGILVDGTAATIVTEDESSSVSGSESSDSVSDSASEMNGSHEDESLDEEENSEEDDDDMEDEHDEDDDEGSNCVVEDLVPKKVEICFKTVVEKDSKVENNEVDYDADPNRFLHGARLSVFACLLCLVKHKENAVSLCEICHFVHCTIHLLF